MNPLKRFPRLNSAWMEVKHRVAHWRARRERDLERDATVGDPRNVLVVVVDSLRADHVSAFGHERETTPALDAFVDEARAFSNAKAPAPWTFPSIPSLLSGRYPHEHGGRMQGDPRNLAAAEFPTRPRESVPMLPDVLEAAGYDTAMFTAIPMAEKAAGDRFQRVSVTYTDANERVAAARDWIRGRDRWLCHLQLGDPHAPLDVPDEHRETFDVPDVDGLEDWRYRESTDGEGFETYRDARTRAYDAAIRGADDALAALLDDVDDDTVVVVCGDHGEAFWEHVDVERRLNDDPRGYYGTDHGHSVLEDVARVPLWIRAPGVDSGVDDDPVSLTAVAPVVLDALDAEVADGVDPAPLDVVRDARPLLCEETNYGYNQRAVWVDDRKLVEVPATGTRLAFDVADGAEGDPLDDVPEDLVDALEGYGDGVEGEGAIDVDDETRDRLEELGYLE
ncbi:sulfatase-like hydrolase/transferase [Halorubellus litoreus]|uniref:Sulfatase-like hydrolase/transferase n=1 Tax=Halorubellus litoreus TaxID=755308 RepID=A0ABD5VCY0_9EURY